MAILKEQIATRTKGSMAENEDWWYLCYDTDKSTFFVEHEWHHVKINGLKVDSGTSVHDANTWTGSGSENVEGAQKRLLERANT